jgi:gamma-aminobutyric acid receptor subunit alpha
LLALLQLIYSYTHRPCIWWHFFQLFNSGYDRQIRPLISGPALEVEVNVAVRSIGPVDETSQTFVMDCYFRQFWTDPRLQYNSTTSLDELAMNWAFLNKIWRPDTFIVNGKDSYLHKMTVPNRFIRISPQGRISYSQRLTLKARYTVLLNKLIPIIPCHWKWNLDLAKSCHPSP